MLESCKNSYFLDLFFLFFNFPTSVTTFLPSQSVYAGFQTLSVDWNGFFLSFQSRLPGPACFRSRFPPQIPQKWVATKHHQVTNVQRVAGIYGKQSTIHHDTSLSKQWPAVQLVLFWKWKKPKTHMYVKWWGGTVRAAEGENTGDRAPSAHLQ